MPQMAPIWWSTMFLMFILSYMMMMIIMYFTIYKNKDEKTIKNQPKSNIMIWKW